MNMAAAVRYGFNK